MLRDSTPSLYVNVNRWCPHVKDEDSLPPQSAQPSSTLETLSPSAAPPLRKGRVSQNGSAPRAAYGGRPSSGKSGWKIRAASLQRRCKCRTCPRCLDDAKWERVFNEKFADPDYYRASQTRNGSSLSSP